MLYELLLPLKTYYSPLNIFQYITFRSASAAILALFISFLYGPWIIHKLRYHQIGEEIRSSGPESHLVKKGTPTMGGIIILGSVILPTLLFADLSNTFIQIILLSLIWMGVIGFLDDYLKVIKKFEKGLIAKYKLIGQITLGIIISLWIYNAPEYQGITSSSSIPFLKNYELDFGLFNSLFNCSKLYFP